MTGTVWRRNDEWVGAEVEDSFVMVNIDTGKYVALNSTASVVWDALDTPASQIDIETRLQEAYAVDAEQCRASVTRLLDQMRELQLASPV